MLFLTYWFVLYILVLYPLYWLIPHRRARLAILVAGSAIFHTHFAGPAGVLPIAALGAIVYLVALTRNRVACVIGIILSAATLVYYKYTCFIFQSVLEAIWPGASTSMPLESDSWLNPVPPLAVSFFTFEFIHYLVDVRAGAPALRKPRDFTLFSIYWPSIVAGPVKRYQDFLPALNQGVRGVNSDDVAVGLVRLSIGISKKLVADILTPWLAFSKPQFETLAPEWKILFVAGLSMRILLDFSGYSDMAIGLSRMHGITLPENFRWPYLATSLSKFWQRWHCSLSLWIRDYVYISLGGNRCGLARKTANGLLAFAICGLWHGAAWNFLVWGLYHGAGLAVTSSYRVVLGPPGRGIGWALDRVPLLGWAITLVYVSIGWIFFFFPVGESISMLRSLFGLPC